jgi:hypothetical protein
MIPDQPFSTAKRNPIASDPALLRFTYTSGDTLPMMQRSTHSASQLRHDIAQHSTGMARMAGRNLFLYGRQDGLPPLPYHTQLARPQCVKPLSLEKLVILLVNMNV